MGGWRPTRPVDCCSQEDTLPETLPDLESLRCFLAAAETLNFRAAAKRVGLTPAALGQRIKQLEGLFETPLFSRTTRRVSLTEAGQALVPQATDALATARACHHAARGALGPAPISLTLGTRHELGLSWILPALPALEQRLPHVTFHLYFGSGTDLSNRVAAQQLDCAIHSSRVLDPGLEFEALHREDYVLVAAPELLAQRPIEDLDDLARHTLVDIGPQQPLFRYWTDSLPPGRAVRFHDGRWMGTIAAIRSHVLAGRGVAVLPAYLVAPDLHAGRLVTLLPEIEAQADHFRLLFRSDDPRRSALTAVADCLRGRPLA